MKHQIDRLLTHITDLMSACVQRYETVAGLLRTFAAFAGGLRQVGAGALASLRAGREAGAYDTRWLELVFDIADSRGERVVVTRRQRVRFLAPGPTTVRELVWGDGQLVARYAVRGARRVGERFEGSKRAILLDPLAGATPGTCTTIRSRRTLRAAFRGVDEYCEGLVERPTGRLDLAVRFPAARPPRGARLVSAATERVLRLVPVSYGKDGRPRLRCRIRKPVLGVVYSLRWSW